MPGLLLPRAIFNTKTLRVVEIYRPAVFLIDLQAEIGKVLFNDVEQRMADALTDGFRGNKQCADKARFNNADESL